MRNPCLRHATSFFLSCGPYKSETVPASCEAQSHTPSPGAHNAEYAPQNQQCPLSDYHPPHEIFYELPGCFRGGYLAADATFISQQLATPAALQRDEGQKRTLEAQYHLFLNLVSLIWSGTVCNALFPPYRDSDKYPRPDTGD